MHSLYRHITNNNRVNWGLYQPLWLAGQKMGMVHESVVEALLTSGHVLPQEGGLRLNAEGGNRDERTKCLEACLHHLVKVGLIRKVRKELYDVAHNFGDAPVALADRALMPALGFKAHGVHCNGFVREDKKIKLWVARRSMDSTTDPGKLDHIIAGGQPHGYSLSENLAKEAYEEAGVEAALAAKAILTGTITYNLGMAHGIRRDTLHVFDLELPATFTPRNTDGEVMDFRLMEAEEVLERLKNKDDFKFNVNLVLVDFFIRHGFITPDENGFAELKAGLKCVES